MDEAATRSLQTQQVSTTHILEALQTLPVQPSPAGRGKRHQPLTMLWAIGTARQGQPRLSRWPDARPKIEELIRDFGHATDRSNAYLPFLALAGTGLWELTATPPKGLESSARRQWLNNANPAVCGGLAHPVYDLMAGSGETAAEAVGVLLDTYLGDMTPTDLLKVLQATGLQDLVGHADDSGLKATHAPHPRSRDAGRLADAALRCAIESHAVRRARNHYHGQGYEVTELGKPYDLRAVKDGVELHVEVKGSTMSADGVELTTNEVRHASENRTDLYVVDQIQWEVKSDGTVSTTGGRVRHWPGWRPAAADLSPTRYRYRLSAAHSTGETT